MSEADSRGPRSHVKVRARTHTEEGVCVCVHVLLCLLVCMCVVLQAKLGVARLVRRCETISAPRPSGSSPPPPPYCAETRFLVNFIPHCREQQAAPTALCAARSSYTAEQCAARHLTQRGGGRWGGVSTFLFVNRLTTCPDLRARVLFNKLPVCARHRLPCAYQSHSKAAELAATSFFRGGAGGHYHCFPHRNCASSAELSGGKCD